jgi:cell division protein FtsN
MSTNRPYDDDLPGRSYSNADSGDREISLGTPTILGIFFSLALVCAGFFGFGYAVGRRSAQSTPPTIAGDPLPVNPNAPKPAAGSAAAQAIAPAPQPPSDASTSPAFQTAVVPLTAPSASSKAANPADGMVVGDKFPPATPQPATSAQPATSFVVQVAAVSSQDVADILTSSLQKKGYTVAVRHESQDKLLHVQIGPFTDKKEAQAMQARVLADGFNAIVK